MARALRLPSSALWAIVVILALHFALFTANAAEQPTNGFVAYYTAARLLESDVPASRFYDDDRFSGRTVEDAPGVRDIFTPNPPTAALLLLPLAGLSYAHARLIWTLLNLACLALALAWMLRERRLSRLLAPLVVGLALISQPVLESMHQGQAYALVLLLLVVAWYGYRHERPALLGVALGLALVFKTAGLLLALLLLLRRRWRAAGWMLGSALAVGIASLPWLGVNAWKVYAERLGTLTSEPDLVVTAYQTIPGFIRHLTTPAVNWNPAPLLDAPEVGRALSTLAVIAIAALSLAVAARSATAPDLSVTVVLIATTLVSPLSLDYHYLLLLLPTIILIDCACRRRARLPALLLIVATVLIATGIPYRSPVVRDGIFALLGYPKLMGGLILWGLSLYACYRPGAMTDEDWAHSAGLQRRGV